LIEFVGWVDPAEHAAALKLSRAAMGGLRLSGGVQRLHEDLQGH
jgi:hypothetical protein